MGQRKQGLHIPRCHFGCSIWVWVEVNPPGIGPQVLVFGSIYRASLFGYAFLTHTHGETGTPKSLEARAGKRPEPGRGQPGPKKSLEVSGAARCPSGKGSVFLVAKPAIRFLSFLDPFSV